jgi:diguanylate cyclase (GGDEF)-like protein/PAS domain S-box-containing protein
MDRWRRSRRQAAPQGQFGRVPADARIQYPRAGADDEAVDLWIPTSFVLAAASGVGAHLRATRAVRASGREQRRRADAYLEIAEVLMVGLDTEGRVRMANRKACKTLGRSERELLGADWFDAAVPRHEREIGRAALASLIEGDVEVVREYEMAVLAADGSQRLIEWHHAVRVDESGHVIGTLSSGLDITERRAAEQRLAREQRDLAGLRRLAQAVASQDDARNSVVRSITELTASVFAALCELEPEGEAFAITAATRESMIGERIVIGDDEPSGVVRAFRTRSPFFVGDARAHPATSPRLSELARGHSFLYHPVEVAGRVAGVLVVGWAEDIGSPHSREADLVALAADEAAVALQRRMTMRELEEAALSDALTGVANRRAFDRGLAKELARARRSKQSFSLAVMDLNGFKALNDAAGHEAGDLVLQAVAGAWIGELRITDTLARLGGDEFAALLPDCGPADAPLVAARLRRAVPHLAGAGVGIAVWDGIEDAASLLRRADQALYTDKARLAADRLQDPERLAALEATGLGRGSSLAKLDELARTVAGALHVPVATVTLVDGRREVFAGSCGLDADVAEEGAPLSHSFCQHAVTTGRPLVIADTRESPVAAGNRAVEELDVIAYAGVPLIDRDGHALGALCAIDHAPHDWGEEDLLVLRRFAERAVLEIEHAARAVSAP